MASIWKHPQSKYWTACFRDFSGRQRRISTKESNHRLAQKIAEAYEQVARAKKTRAHTQRVIERLHEEVGGEPLSAETVRAYATRWLQQKEPEVSPRTFDFYNYAIPKFLGWLGPKADSALSEITKTDLIAYRTFLCQTLSAQTTNHDLSAIRMLFLSARREEVLFTNPAEFVDGVRARNGTQIQRRAFTIPELQAILTSADPEWKSMIYFGVYTGQRLGDIASLTWNNIDLQKCELRLVTRKTNRTLILPLAEPLQRHLEALPSADRGSAPLHPRAAATLGRHGRSAALSNQFSDLLADAGLRPRKNHESTGKGRNVSREGSSLSFHSLRRTATTLLHEAGVPQQVVQAIIGHDSSEIHQLYVAIGKDAMRAATARMPEL